MGWGGEAALTGNVLRLPLSSEGKSREPTVMVSGRGNHGHWKRK